MEQLMKIDPTTLKSLRDARAWSQEHLASVAGLSVRTVQRIEADGSASAESRLALAAALDVSAADLCPPSSEASAAVLAAEPGRLKADARRHAGWKRHLAIYLLAAALLSGLKLAFTGTLGWALFPLLGWGAGLLLHYWLSKRAKRRTARLAIGPQ